MGLEGEGAPADYGGGTSSPDNQDDTDHPGKVYPCSRWLLCKRNFNEKKQQKKGKSHELEKVDVFIK